MTDYRDLVGAIIVGAEESDYGSKLTLRLASGGVALVESYGYEDTEIGVTVFTLSEWAERLREEAAEERRREEQLEAAREKREAAIAEWKRRRDAVPADAREAWEVEHPQPGSVGAFGQIMKDLYVEPMLRQMMNRQVFPGG